MLLIDRMVIVVLSSWVSIVIVLSSSVNFKMLRDEYSLRSIHSLHAMFNLCGIVISANPILSVFSIFFVL